MNGFPVKNKNDCKFKGLLAFSFFCLFYFIVSGNALTFYCFGFAGIKSSEMLLAIDFVALLLINLKIRYLKSAAIKINRLMFAWVIYSSIIVLFQFLFNGFSFRECLTGLSYGVRFVFYLLYSMYLMCFLLKFSKVRKFENCIIASFLVVCLIGVVQLLVWPAARDFYAIFLKLGTYISGTDPHQNRLVSTFFDPNYLASCLLIPFYLLLKRLIHEKNKKIVNLLLLLCLTLTIFLTKSRSGFLGMAVILILMFLKSLFSKSVEFKYKILFVLFFCFLVLYFPFSTISVVVRIRSGISDPSSLARFDSWKIGLDLFSQHPIFGIGYNMIGAYKSSMHYNSGAATLNGFDSSLVVILCCSGLVGTIPFLFYFCHLIFDNKISYEFKTFVFASIVICNFNQLLFYPFWLLPFNFCYLDEKLFNPKTQSHFFSAAILMDFSKISRTT